MAVLSIIHTDQRSLYQQMVKDNTLPGKFPRHHHLLCTGMKPGSRISGGCGFLLPITPPAFFYCAQELLSKLKVVTGHSLQGTVQREHQQSDFNISL